MKQDAVTAARHSLNARLAAAPYLALAVLMVGAMLFLVGATAVRVPPAHWETQSPADPQSAQRRDDAVQAFVDQRYSAAYGRFASLADEGHAASALIALAIVSHAASVRDRDE